MLDSGQFDFLFESASRQKSNPPCEAKDQAVAPHHIGTGTRGSLARFCSLEGLEGLEDGP
jgi:hypothetical protein